MVDGPSKAVGVHFPNDIYHTLLPYLRNPLPPPLSSPLRSAIRQPHLAAAMLVSRRFKEICQPLLYKDILTDNLPLLIRGNSGSKANNLSFTKSLLIEYSAKGTQPVPSYEELCEYGGGTWRDCGVVMEVTQEGIIRACRMEVDELTPCVDLLDKRGMPSILPKLESIAISSRYGRQAYTRGAHAMLPRLPMMTTFAFQRFLSGGSLKSFCLRDSSGPLSLVGCTPSNANPFHTTAHFGSEFGDLPIILGNRTTWSYEGPPEDDWSRLLTLIGQRLHSIRHSPMYETYAPVVLRIECSTSRFGPASFVAQKALFYPNDMSFMLQRIYNPPVYPTLRELSPFLQTAMSAQFDKELRKAFASPSTGSASTMSWAKSLEVPGCEACGWCSGE